MIINYYYTWIPFNYKWPWEWVIPETIHTIPRTAFRNSKGKGGSLNWKSESLGDTNDWNFEGMGGGLDLGFPQETDKSVFLENPNFLDF